MLPCPWCACWPNGVPGRRMKATRLPSGDHVGTGVVIDARRQKRHRARAHVVDADQRVIDAVADEGELRSVRRPCRALLLVPQALIHGVPSFGASAEARRSGASCGGRPRYRRYAIDLPVLRVRDRASVRRQRRRRAFAELPRGAACGARRPDRPRRRPRDSLSDSPPSPRDSAACRARTRRSRHRRKC